MGKRGQGWRKVGKPKAVDDGAAGSGESTAETVMEEEGDPFDGLQIADRAPLHETNARFQCEMTGRSFAYYSYTCFNQEFNERTTAMTADERRRAVLGQHWADSGQVPVVELPVPLHIVHHKQEKLSKSTGVHAAVLAPSTTMHHFPDLPTGHDPSEVALLFPSEGASLQGSLSDEDFAAIKHIYVIDSTWQQAKMIHSDPRLHGVRHITIAPRKTKFWRYQDIGEYCLSSIEAIYYTYKEYLTRKNGAYHGEVDNLLFYFSFFHEKIQHAYTQGRHAADGKTFTNRHPGGTWAGLSKHERCPKSLERPIKKYKGSSEHTDQTDTQLQEGALEVQEDQPGA